MGLSKLSASASPIARSGRSSSAATPTDSASSCGSRTPGVAGQRPSAEAEPALDRDAIEALAWIESGMPDDRIAYGPDAPRLTPEQLREFKPASYTPQVKPKGLR
jgi:hypothetical protein